MAAPIALREDFDGPGLRRLAKRTKDAAQGRRLLALAEIYDGGSRSDAARIGGVTLQIARDWVLRFNKHGPEVEIVAHGGLNLFTNYINVAFDVPVDFPKVALR